MAPLSELGVAAIEIQPYGQDRPVKGQVTRVDIVCFDANNVEINRIGARVSATRTFYFQKTTVLSENNQLRKS